MLPRAADGQDGVAGVDGVLAVILEDGDALQGCPCGCAFQ